MKKIIIPVIIMLLAACGSKDENHNARTATKGPVSTTDSLLKYIDENHTVGMSRIGPMHMAKQRAQEVIDSITKLPAKIKESLSGYVSSLQNAIKDIDYADFAMDKWMMEINTDSLEDQPEARLTYLSAEKAKLQKMNDAIINGLKRADSLLSIKLR